MRSADDARPVLKVPAVPRQAKNGDGRADSGTGGTTEPTRLLCAAAHLRPDRAAEFADNLRKWRRKQAKQIRARLTPKRVPQRRLEKAAAEALSGEKTTLEKILTDDEPTAPEQPRMVVGHEYVRWVRRHVVTARRPTPS